MMRPSEFPLLYQIVARSLAGVSARVITGSMKLPAARRERRQKYRPRICQIAAWWANRRRVRAGGGDNRG